MKHVLVVKAGTYTGPRETLGDYDGWFSDLVAEAGMASRVWLPEEQAPPEETPAAIVVSGSSASMTATTPWIDRLASWVSAAARRGVPVLGVCFGHQLLAQALGGRVEQHPVGREVGTVEMELTEAGRRDPLFEDFPARFDANATHRDHVARLPEGATVLARNDFVPVQAFGVGDNVRGVQFHPEYTGERLLAYAERNPELLEREAGPGTAARVLGAIRDTPIARRVVGNFVRRIVLR